MQFKDAPEDMFSPIVAKSPSPAKGKNSAKSPAFKSKTLLAHNEFRASVVLSHFCSVC